MGYVDGPDDRDRAFAAEHEVKRLTTRLRSLREQVQRERDLRYEHAEEHAEMAGHEHQELVCRTRVDTLDMVLGWIDGAEQS